MPVDAEQKARHCTLMVLAAAQLADCAPEEAQKRALARYAFVFADAGLEWMRKWRNELARSGEREQERCGRLQAEAAGAGGGARRGRRGARLPWGKAASGGGDAR